MKISQKRQSGLGVLLLGLALTISSMLVAQTSLAQSEDQSSKQPVDIRVIIDVSGSMKKNDPANLRQPAVELLVNLLPEGSKAGVWTFGRYINMLVPHKTVNQAWRADALESAGSINSKGLYTNIGEALEKSAYDFDRPSDEYKTSFILLTDGMVDIDKDPEKNQEEWRRIADDVLSNIEGAGYTVHTIALSRNADTALMDKLAIATDGMSEVAESADDLMKIFLRIFDQAAPAEQVPLEGNNFLVDSSIEEFTALIFRNSDDQPTRLLSPDQTEYAFDREDSDVSWYKTSDYDLITVQRPLEGEWTVVADIDPDSRITIVSNLSLLVKPMPTNMFVGQTTELSALLQEEGRTVTDANFLSLLNVVGAVDEEDVGRQWGPLLEQSQPPANGVYTDTLSMFEQEGRYLVSVNVDGKSFKRKYHHQLIVRQPFSASVQSEIDSGRESFTVQVRAHSQTVDAQRTVVTAQVSYPDGKIVESKLTRTANDDWELELQPELQGSYKVELDISGVDKQGQRFAITADPVNFQYPSSDNPFATAEEDPAAEPEPEKEASKPDPEAAEPVEEVVEEEESSQMLLYVGLGVGNLLIIILAYFAYRMFMGGNKTDPLDDVDTELSDDEEEEVEDVETQAVEEEPAPIEEPVAETPEEPAEINMEAIENVEPIEQDAEPLAMDEGLDLSSDEVADADIPMQEMDEEVDNMLSELQEPEEEDDEEIADFSLDDFEPDSLDDLDDEDEEQKT